MATRFAKYQALGNDYLVIDPQNVTFELTPERVRAICDRHFGLGADGILFGPLPSDQAQAGLRIYNPDGSEAEKSGNGLRIFCRYLYDAGQVGREPFTIQTPGGTVNARVLQGGRVVRVEIGRASFWSTEIPVTGPAREVLEEEIQVGGQTFLFCAVTLGNPHCTLLLDEISPAQAHLFGPLIEVHPLFPRRTNVQFVQVLNRSNLRLEIWERGAGYTLASGSSASAAAAAAYRLGRCKAKVTAHMPGGDLQVEVGEEFTVTITGPVRQVATGELSDEIFGETG